MSWAEEWPGSAALEPGSYVFLCFFLEATRASDYESIPGSSSRAALATKHIDHASRAAVRDPTVDSLLAFDSELFSGRVEGCHCYTQCGCPTLVGAG